MLHLILVEVARRDVRVQEEITPDHPIWDGIGATPRAPLAVDLSARSVGQGLLIAGTLRGTFEVQCRRCLTAVTWDLDEEINLWFEPLEDEEERFQLEGEVYPMPARGTELDLTDAVREQLLLRIPDYLLCREDCLGLCPQCGIDLNQAQCTCVEEPTAGPWDVLKQIKFD